MKPRSDVKEVDSNTAENGPPPLVVFFSLLVVRENMDFIQLIDKHFEDIKQILGGLALLIAIISLWYFMSKS